MVIAGIGDDELGGMALQRGAQDYLLEGHLDRYAFDRALRNVTERESARHELFIEHERAQVTLNSIADAVLSVDVDGHVTYMNTAAEQLTGWSNGDAVGRQSTEVFHIVDSETREVSRNPFELAVQLDKPVALSADCILISRTGQESAIEDSTAPIHDRHGHMTGAVIVFHDVSMARRMVLEMSHRAQHDALTELPNRLLLKDRLTQAVLLARRKHAHLAVLFLDLDGFKHVNDSLGHAVGDVLLKAIAACLSACVRESDTVSRQGGDEFVILLPEITNAADAAVSAAKIIAELAKTRSAGHHRLRVTASIGIATYPESGADAETLVMNADVAMYHAKAQGRDNYQFFTRDMNLHAVERQSIEGRLRYAVEDDELVLHYQPKVDLTTGAMTSAEALLRWHHPNHGLLLPAQFLAIAEDSGMILTIGRWVLNEACRQTRAWLDAGFRAVPVAINVSSLEFRSRQFLDGVRQALALHRLDARYLELELTETVMMGHAESATWALEELKSLGVRLAIDDFGTGYSSLSYLTRFPIDTLKLDRSFVSDIERRDDEAIVASAVISMAKSLKHKVIAEGVETAEQVALLQSLGCDEAQGFYFSRPVDADRFARLLETGVDAANLPWTRPPGVTLHGAVSTLEPAPSLALWTSEDRFADPTHVAAPLR